MINFLEKTRHAAYALSMFILWLFGIAFTMVGGYALTIKWDMYYSYFSSSLVLYYYRFIDLPLSGLVQALDNITAITLYPQFSILAEFRFEIMLPIILLLMGCFGLLSLLFINQHTRLIYVWYVNIILLFSFQILELNIGLYSDVGSYRELGWILGMLLCVFFIHYRLVKNKKMQLQMS